MSARARACLLAAPAALACALFGCPDQRPVPHDNQPVVGAPSLEHSSYATNAFAPVDAGLPANTRFLDEHLPDEAARQFKTLAAMERSPRWSKFAALIREQTRPLYALRGAARKKPPHDIVLTQYFIRKMPEVYGVDFVAWCGADFGGTLSYVENHLLVARRGDALEVLTSHRPTCGSVGDRSVAFSDLVVDGQDELIEVYVEDTAVGEDVQEIRVFSMATGRLARVAEIRAVSPVKFFHHEFRRTDGTDRDIVTTHIEMEKTLARQRKRPCFVYRYFEIESTYRYQRASHSFVHYKSKRKRMAQNAALDLTGGEAPEGSCGG